MDSEPIICRLPKPIDSALAKAIIPALTARRMHIATAESLTGGLLSASLTAVAGASECFSGGIVSYTDSIKSDVLGVDAALIAAHTAVSAPCALQMANRARMMFATDYALAVTGYAGPAGGDGTNPVGTVYIALAAPANTTCRRYYFPDQSREEIREMTVNCALEWLLSVL